MTWAAMGVPHSAVYSRSGAGQPSGSLTADCADDRRLLQMELDDLSYRVIGAAYRVHSQLGPGLLEAAYEKCLAAELDDEGLRYARQPRLALRYNGRRIGNAYRPDLIVERAIVVEIKAVTQLTSVDLAQILTYLKLSGCTLGLLLNFHVADLKKGIKRVVLGYPEPGHSSGH